MEFIVRIFFAAKKILAQVMCLSIPEFLPSFLPLISPSRNFSEKGSTNHDDESSLACPLSLHSMGNAEVGFDVQRFFFFIILLLFRGERKRDNKESSRELLQQHIGIHGGIHTEGHRH